MSTNLKSTKKKKKGWVLCTICGVLTESVYSNNDPIYCDACFRAEAKAKKAYKAKAKKYADKNFVVKTKTIECSECKKRVPLLELISNQSLCCTKCFKKRFPDNITQYTYTIDKANEMLLNVSEEQRLPDQGCWQNRFKIGSDSSIRVYIVAQNRNDLTWACSCPGWKRFRKCKHLVKMGLIAEKKNSFSSGYEENASIPKASDMQFISTPSKFNPTEIGSGIKKRKISFDE